MNAHVPPRPGYLPGELPKAFGRLDVLRYADEDARPDYDQQTDRRVVRFLARSVRTDAGPDRYVTRLR